MFGKLYIYFFNGFVHLYVQCLQKIFTPLDFFVTGLHTIPHNAKVALNVYKWFKNEKIKCFESFNPFVMASLNKFRSKNVQYNKLHGLTLSAIIVFNMIFEWLPHLCTPHIQLSLRSLSRAVNFKYRFNHKDQGGIPMPLKEVHLLIDG